MSGWGSADSDGDSEASWAGVQASAVQAAPAPDVPRGTASCVPRIPVIGKQLRTAQNAHSRGTAPARASAPSFPALTAPCTALYTQGCARGRPRGAGGG